MQRRRDEDGAVVAIVVLSLIAIFGMVVISVDVGGVVLRRREMVNANDSAALAAAIAFAQKELEATCGVTEDPAKDAATDIAESNVTGSIPVSFTTDCVNQTVSVVYKKDQQLFFAPVLGFSDTATVNAAATAKWGQSTGGNPMPIELDPLLTANCAFVDPASRDQFKPPGPCPEGFWFNNQDLTNSGWGMMNLASWGSAPGDNCNNKGGANLLGDWITQAVLIDVHLQQIPTFVCTTDGGKSPNWFADLESQAGTGKVFLFPVNDPAQTIYGPPTSQQKYAIVAFAPMTVDHVYHGNDPLAYGTPGTAAQSGSCSNKALGASGVGDPTIPGGFGGWDLAAFADANCGANGPAQTISGVVVNPQGGSAPPLVACTTPGVTPAGCDYYYNPTNKILSWWDLSSKDTGNRVSFNWSIAATPGVPGACGIRDSDPNAKCVVLSWAGPQLIGTDPGPPGPGYGAQSVTLVK